MSKRKREVRILAYGLCRQYVAYATYRKDFLEEFSVVALGQVYDLTEHARRVLKTFQEVSYILPCTESKYSHRLRGFKVVEGGDYLYFLFKYCDLIYKILCTICRRGLLNPPSVDLVVDTSDKCHMIGGGTWLGCVPDVEA